MRKKNQSIFFEIFHSINNLRWRIFLVWKYRKIFHLFGRTLKLGKKMFLQKEKIFLKEKDYFNNTLVFFFIKNIHLIRSIKTLCRDGFAKDTVVLLRVMFEDFINLKYISLNKKRAKDFIDYTHYKHLKQAHSFLRSGYAIDKKKVKKTIRKLEKRWDKVKDRFSHTTKKGKEKIHSRWSCKDLRDMSIETGDVRDYDYLYSYLCNYVHISPLIAKEYILGKDKKGVRIAWGASGSLLKEISFSVIILFLKMLDIIDEKHGMGFSVQIKKILSETKKLNKRKSKNE